jgi:hypothetical protein
LDLKQGKQTGPGQIFEVDATVADVYLISSSDPNIIVGRPVVYIVVDTVIWLLDYMSVSKAHLGLEL